MKSSETELESRRIFHEWGRDSTACTFVIVPKGSGVGGCGSEGEATALAASLNDMAAENGRLKEEVERLSSGGFSMEQAIACGFTVDEIYKEEKKEYEEKITSLTAENARLADQLASKNSQIVTMVDALENAQAWLANCKPIGQPTSRFPLPLIASALAGTTTTSRDEGKEEKLWFVDTVFQMDEEGYSSPDTRFYVRGEAGYFLDSTKAQDLCNRLNASAARFLEGE